MSIALIWNNEQQVKDIEDTSIHMLQKILNYVAKIENIDDGELSLTFVDDSHMKKLNAEYRNVDRTTDVLSFPMMEIEQENKIVYTEEQKQQWLGMPYLLGDIIISIPRAIAQSEEYKHSFERELGFLFVHGLLHLLGYEHEDRENEIKMIQKQEHILSQVGLKRYVSNETIWNADNKNIGEHLIEEAMKARTNAYMPYSKFAVGAVLLDEKGVLHYGCNVENAAYGMTNCAERTALFRAIADGHRPRSFQAIAVVGDTERPITPCGACRQVFVELCHPQMKVFLGNLKHEVIETTVDALLPDGFSSAQLFQ